MPAMHELSGRTVGSLRKSNVIWAGQMSAKLAPWPTPGKAK